MPNKENSVEEVKLSPEIHVQSNNDPIKQGIVNGLNQKANPEPAVKTNSFIDGDLQNNVSRALSNIQNDRLAQTSKPKDDPATSKASETESSVPAEDVTPTEEEGVTETVSDDSDSAVVDETTSQEETDNEGNEEDEWFYLGDFTQYRTKEDALEGITKTQRYLNEILKPELDQIKTQAAEKDALLQFYSKLLPEDQVTAKVIDTYLPEEFQGKTEEDFDNDTDLRKYFKAVADAENQFQREVDAAKDAALTAKKEQDDLSKQAKEYVETKINAQFFGAKNPAEAKAVEAKLSEVVLTEGDDKVTVRDAGRLIHELLGETASNIFFRGIKDDLSGAIRQTSVKPGPPATTVVKKDQKTQTVAKKVKETKVEQKPIVSVAPAMTPQDNRTAAEKVALGLAQALGKKR